MSVMSEYIKKMLDSAKTRKSRNDLRKGSYVFSILGLVQERREKREKLGKAFWIDVVVDECSQDGDLAPTPVGSKLDFPLVLEGQFADMAFQDLKTFLAELTGCGDEQVSAKWEELVDVVGDEGGHSNTKQLARGMRIYASTRTAKIKTGKNAGTEKTYPLWQHVDQTPEEIAARRKELDAAGA